VEISGIITAIVVGAIVGALARLIVPGKQNMGVIVTIIVGIIAALIGTWLGASVLGLDGWFLIFLIQLGLAALAVFVIAGSQRGTRGRRT
jgi:uncharacterized membrane protein YeaQ/YmgE (transglycosylase-associated protein family)